MRVTIIITLPFAHFNKIFFSPRKQVIFKIDHFSEERKFSKFRQVENCWKEMEYDISFLGTTLNAELQKSLSLIQKSPLPLLKEFIQLAVDYLKGEDITDDFFTNFCSKFDGLEKSVGSVLLTGIYCIFRAALRKRVKADKFQLDLLEIKVPQPVINELSFAFYEKFVPTQKYYLNITKLLPTNS